MRRRRTPALGASLSRSGRRAPLMSQPESAATAAVLHPWSPFPPRRRQWTWRTRRAKLRLRRNTSRRRIWFARRRCGTGDWAAASAASAQAWRSRTTYPAGVPTTAYDNESQIPQAKIEIEPAKEGAVLSAFLSPVGAAVFLGQGVLLLFLLRQRVPARKGSVETKETLEATSAADEAGKNVARDGRGSRQRKSRRSSPSSRGTKESTPARRAQLDARRIPSSSQHVQRKTIKQEVSKL